MMPPHVYVDVDDVLAETTRALARLARSHFGKRVAFDEMAHFDLGRSLGLDADEYPRFMEAAHDESFLLDLPAMRGAVDTVARWHRAGAEISVVTGRPPATRHVTARWLEREALPYHRLEIVDKYGRYGETGATSKEALVERGYALVIEDSVEMATWLAERTDAVVLLVDRPWNRGSDVGSRRVRRVHDWPAIASAFTETFPTWLAPDS